MSVCCECGVFSVRRADHSSRGYLPNVVLELDSEESLDQLGSVAPCGKKLPRSCTEQSSA